MRQTARELTSAKHVAESSGDAVDKTLVSIDRERSIVGEHPEIVDTVEMVGMVVGVQDRIQMLDAGAYRLQAELRPGVYQDALSLYFE